MLSTSKTRKGEEEDDMPFSTKLGQSIVLFDYRLANLNRGQMPRYLRPSMHQ